MAISNAGTTISNTGTVILRAGMAILCAGTIVSDAGTVNLTEIFVAGHAQNLVFSVDSGVFYKHLAEIPLKTLF